MIGSTTICSGALLLLLGILSVVRPDTRQGGGLQPWVMSLAGPRESGTRLVVTGRLLGRNGGPVSRRRIHVYHADAAGQYGRFDGWLTTGPQGQYEVRTIRPGGYGGFGGHIHFVADGQAFQLLLAADSSASDPRARPRSPDPFQSMRERKLVELPANRDPFTERESVDSTGVHHVSKDLRLR